MLTRRSTSMLAPVVTLAFSAVMLLPCLCATAMAQDVESTVGDEAGCCPETGEPAESQDEPGDSDDDCCCEGATSCANGVDVESPLSIDATTSSSEETDIDEPTTWWTPDLVATLWVVDVLADALQPQPSAHPEPDDVRPDESGTYLKTATLLI